MSIIISKRLKTALVLLCTMLIFFQIMPVKNSLRVCAAQNNSYDDDDDDYEIDDEEYDEDDGEIIIIEDDDDEEDTDEQVNEQPQSQAQPQPQKQNQVQTVSQDEKKQEKKQEKDDKQAAKKTKVKHKKITVDVSAKKRDYNNKLSVGDELKITVKAKNKKIKNKILKFSSSKNSVVTVSADGVITAKKNGTAKIKIVNKKKKSQKCYIVVTVTKK